MSQTTDTDDTTTATLIQCTNTKRDEPAPARDLYEPSGYFRDMRSWATARDGPWFILSGKHGLLDPDTVIGPYDARGLSEQQAETAATALAVRGVKTVWVCAGRDYTGTLVPACEAAGIDVIDPFAGLRIGERRQELQARTEGLDDSSA